MVKAFGKIFSGGKLEKDLTALQRKAAQEPNNYYLLVKIGDLLEKMGRRAEALRAYHQASEKYAQKGFLVQAIAVNKLILRLDPSQEQIHEKLANLYAQRDFLVQDWPEGGLETITGSSKPIGRWPFIPLFADLQQAELARVMDKLESKFFPQGGIICREGEVGDSIFIICHGGVAVFRKNAQGHKIYLAHLSEGDFFGEFGFLANARRQASVEARVDTEVLEISKSNMEQIIKEFPTVGKVLFKFYKERVLDTLLATSSLFSSLPAEGRKKLLSKFVLEEYPAGAIILKEGTSGDSLFIIKKGVAEVYTQDQKGRPVSLAKLKEGDFFGEIALITGRPRTASVKAVEAMELVCLPKKDFIEIIQSCPEIKKVLKETLLLRLEDKLKSLGIFQESPEKEGLV